MTDVLRSVTLDATPQTEPAGDATVKTAGGGYGFPLEDRAALNQFIVTGVAGGTFYTSGPDLAREHAQFVHRLVQANPQAVVDAVVEISVHGRAVKQSPALFVLAMAVGEADAAGKRYALAALPRVCRTLSQLFMFLDYSTQFNCGWGLAFKRALADWLRTFGDSDPNRLAYQLLKYRARYGYDVRRLLQLARPYPPTEAHDALFEFFMIRANSAKRPSARAIEKFGDSVGPGLDRYDDPKRGAWSPHAGRTPEQSAKWASIPPLVPAFLELQDATPARAAAIIAERRGAVAWEMLPDRLHNEVPVWEAMLAHGVPTTALLRQLPRLTNLGLTKGQTGQLIVKQLTDPGVLKRSRIHPLQMLTAQRVYASGYGTKGTWTPTPNIIDGLHDGFIASYGAVEPIGLPIIAGIDVSKSMTWNSVGSLNMMAMEVSGVLAHVFAQTEPDVTYLGFHTLAWPLPISKRQRIDDVMDLIKRQPNGGTDCASPIVWAIHNKVVVDAFVLFTDEESWAGNRHTFEWMTEYRRQLNPNAKLAVASMTPKRYSIVDPQDPRALHVVGFDSDMPNLICNFAAGRI